jgi:glycosyltransferase involved in cell wall biosynthesis
MKHLVLIPAWNEEATIAPLVEAVRQHIPQVMVIDDGSEDATTLASALAGAMIHRFNDNRGKGEALKFGFWYALDQKYDWVITIDGDGQHDPADILSFLPLLENFDLVLGNRMNDAARIPFKRRWANRALSAVISILAGQRIYDSQCGFRAYRVALLGNVPLSSHGYELETEVLIKAARRGFRIGHCRVKTIYPGVPSRFRKLRDGYRFTMVVLKSFFWR